MDEGSQNRAIQRIIVAIPKSNREVIAAWVTKLLEIAHTNIGSVQKAKLAIRVTKESRVIAPIVKMMAAELKRVGWDERSWAARLALSGIAIGSVLFSGEGAGIAAFGTAIGVPLWIVLGGGGALAGALVDELKRKPS